MKLTIGHWTLALGMEWVMPSSSRELREAKQQRPKAMYAQAGTAGERWVGFHEPTKAKKVHSAALLVGMIHPNCIFYSPIEDTTLGAGAVEQAWVCAITQGRPFVGYDRIEPLVQAQRVAQEWSAAFGCEIIGPIGNGTRLADVLDVLDGRMKARAIKRKQVDEHLLHARGLPIHQIGRAGAAALLVGGAYYGTHAYEDWKQARLEAALANESAARRAAETEQRRTAESAAHATMLRAFGEQVARERVRLESGVSTSAFWSAFTELRQSLPLSLRGFRPSQIECTTQACRVTWHGAGRFTNARERAYLPGAEASLDSELTAASNFSLDLPPATLRTSGATDLHEFKYLLKTDFAARALAIDVAEPQPVTVTPPKGLNVPPVTLAHVGAWRLPLPSRSALVDAQAVINWLESQPLRVTSIKYQGGAAGSASIQLEGQYVYFTDRKARHGA